VTTISQNHRTIEWFGLEGTFKGHLVQLPCNEQGYLQLDQVAQSDLACFQEWQNLFQCFTTLIVENFFLISSINLLSFSLKPLPLLLLLQCYH